MIIQTFTTKTGHTFQLMASAPFDAERNARVVAESVTLGKPETAKTAKTAKPGKIVHRAERLKINIARRRLPHGADSDGLYFADPNYLAPHNNAAHKRS
jgi:hypothetical protein